MSTADDVFAAVYRQDLQALRLMSKRHGALCAFLDRDGRNALMHAVLAEQSSLEVVEFLLHQGCPPNHIDARQGWTALHFAAQAGKTEIASVLLESGADPNIQDAFGNSPLWRAVFCVTDDDALVRLLLSNGADFNLNNRSGVSPIALARTRGRTDIAELMTSSVPL